MGAVDEEDDEIKGSLTRHYYSFYQKQTKVVVVEGRELFLPSMEKCMELFLPSKL